MRKTLAHTHTTNANNNAYLDGALGGGLDAGEGGAEEAAVEALVALPGEAVGRAVSAGLEVVAVRSARALVRALNALIGGAEEALAQALSALPREAVASARLAVAVLRGLRGLHAGVADAAGRDAVVDALAVLEVEAGAHARLARGVVGGLGRGRGGLLAHLNAGLFERVDGGACVSECGNEAAARDACKCMLGACMRVCTPIQLVNRCTAASRAPRVRSCACAKCREHMRGQRSFARARTHTRAHAHTDSQTHSTYTRRATRTYRCELEGGAALVALAGDVVVLGGAPERDLLLLAVLVLELRVLVGEAHSVLLALDLAGGVLGDRGDAVAVRAAAVPELEALVAVLAVRDGPDLHELGLVRAPVQRGRGVVGDVRDHHTLEARGEDIGDGAGGDLALGRGGLGLGRGGGGGGGGARHSHGLRGGRARGRGGGGDPEQSDRRDKELHLGV